MMPILSSLILLPLVAGIGAAIAKNSQFVRAISYSGALATLLLALGLCTFPPQSVNADGLAYFERIPWIPDIWVNYSLGLDGLNRLFILLSTMVVALALLAHGARIERWRAANLLWLEATMLGNFLAQNFGIWFLFYELSLAPAFFLVRSEGSAEANRAALRFFLYTQAGGLAILVGYLAIGIAAGSLEFAELSRQSVTQLLSERFGGEWAGALVFWLVLAGLLVKVPGVPLHGWLAETYGRAPATVVMVLTGTMSKMGLYGILRLVSPVLPEELGRWSPYLLWLAVGSAVFAAFVALVQSELRRAFGYLSINHLSYCLMGVFALGALADKHEIVRASEMLHAGVLVLAFNHGISAAALFGVIAALERRSGGRSGLGDFGGVRSVAPVLSGFSFVAIFASLGLPGLNGFPGEFLVFAGVFQVSWPAAAMACLGLLLAAFLLLNVVQRIFWGPKGEGVNGFEEMRAWEWAWFLPAAATMVALGIWPQAILNLLQWP